MGQRLAALFVASAVVGLSMPAWAGTQSDGERTSQKVLATFEGHGDKTIDGFLMRLRPTPLDEDSRAKVIASLPKDGEVRPSRKDGEKLSAAQRILEYSARAGSVTIKVIDVDSAFVGLYHRAVVLVSARALALLSADELAALTAHEIGHDADWDAYWTAIQRQDDERMRELELKADGIAVLTLQHLGISPERLASAIRTTIRYNDWQDRSAGVLPQTGGNFGMADRYVWLPHRLAFIRTVAQLPWADWPTPVMAGTVSKGKQ
jgi:Peptidase family M48